jgi:hypothetical protein
MVEDPVGGVILIGGSLQSSSYSNLLFRLAHAGEGAKWVQGSIL